MDFPPELEVSITFTCPTKEYIDWLGCTGDNSPTLEGFYAWVGNEISDDCGAASAALTHYSLVLNKLPQGRLQINPIAFLAPF